MPKDSKKGKLLLEAVKKEQTARQAVSVVPECTSKEHLRVRAGHYQIATFGQYILNILDAHLKHFRCFTRCTF
jgi:hypothetical protein